MRLQIVNNGVTNSRERGSGRRECGWGKHFEGKGRQKTRQCGVLVRKERREMGERKGHHEIQKGDLDGAAWTRRPTLPALCTLGSFQKRKHTGKRKGGGTVFLMF